MSSNGTQQTGADFKEHVRANQQGVFMAKLNREFCISDQPSPNSLAGVLHSWKEIAVYMGRGVRTLQRYDQNLGLPVHRLSARKRSAVLAFADELETWLRSRPNCQTVPLLSEGLSPHPEEIEIPSECDSVDEFERAKRKMIQAHAEYVKSLEEYRSAKRRRAKKAVAG
jgi:hypothetical protein